MFARAVHAFYDRPPVLLTVTALFWAGNAIAGQLAAGEIAPFQLVLGRWVLVSGALLWLFGDELRAHWPAVRPRLGFITAMSCLGFTCFNGLFYLASLGTSGVNIGILQGAVPVMVLILAFIAYRTPIRPVQGAGVAVTLGGVVLVATEGNPLALLTLGIGTGDAVMLLACLLYAAYATGLQRRPAIPGRALFTLMATIAAVTAVPFALAEAAVTGPDWPSPAGWAIMLYVAVFPSCLAQLFFMRGVDLIGPGRAGVYFNLVPVFTALMAIGLLGQVFAAYHALALVLVLGGIWLAQRRTL